MCVRWKRRSWVRVQDIIGDRLGKDIHIYSITIDPDTDTVEKLAQYRQKFGARWTFLTGNEQEIIALRRKLGLYIEDIPEGSLNHNVSMIIGNQATGRWMRRSPFENPHVLADQLQNWLSGWAGTDHRTAAYDQAPKLRQVSPGETLYRTRCMSCHTIDGSAEGLLGPDLIGVTRIRERRWLFDWLKAPDRMLAEKDPIAMALYRQYNEVAMPNFSLTLKDVTDLMTFMEAETTRLWGPHTRRAPEGETVAAPPSMTRPGRR